MPRNKLETFYLLSLKTYYQQTWQSFDKEWRSNPWTFKGQGLG